VKRWLLLISIPLCEGLFVTCYGDYPSGPQPLLEGGADASIDHDGADTSKREGEAGSPTDSTPGDAPDARSAACGVVGASCCDAGCSAGTCLHGVCQECGGTGQACCPNLACRGRAVCTSDEAGVCALCGNPGEACCATNACDDAGCCVDSICTGAGATCPIFGGTCAGGGCGTCGGPGQACCADGSCTAASVACLGNRCVECGGGGQPCCEHSACGPQLVCAGASCVVCGGAGEACCKDGCSSLLLVCGDAGACEVCGGPSRPPCAQ
jgi:hypothetical protein